MGITRKFMRKWKRIQSDTPSEHADLARRVVGAVTAMGFVMAPLADADAAIEKVSGDKFLNGNNTAHIYADAALDNEVALNIFKEFNVNAGQIANLYFKEQGGTVWTENLVNIVGSRIDVNGTVNAIKNNNIGGNLFFLSKDGMAVGKGGAINAGSLTVMTPTSEYFVKAGLANWADSATEDVANGAINFINYFGANAGQVDVDAFKETFLTTNWGEIKSLNVPINKKGTITVNGKINTTNGIVMKAAHINIAEDATASQMGTAVLQSGITDFSSLVNTEEINDYNGSVAISQTASGDIVLAAEAQSVNAYDDTFAPLGKDINSNAEGYNVVKADVTVGTGATIVAKGDISITAEASNGAGQSGLFGTDLSGIGADALIGNMAKTVAEVKIDGTVTANTFDTTTGGNIDIHANASNTYVADSISDPANFAAGMLTDMVPLDSDASIVVMESKANVEIGENAVITANSARMDDIETEAGTTVGDLTLIEGEEHRNYALNISASTEMEASAGAAAAAVKLQQKKAGAGSGGSSGSAGSDLGQVVPNVGVAYLDVSNEANVTVKGSVTSKGDTNIGAEAVLQAEATSASDAPTPQTNQDVNNFVNVAVVVADIENKTSVSVTGDAKTAEGLMNIGAVTETEVSTEAMVGAGETSLVNTAVNVTDVATDAKVVVDAAITGADVEIAADNEIDNTFVANNAIGLSKMAAKTASGQKNLTNLFNTAKTKTRKPSGLETFGEFFTAGASIGVLDEVNQSSVTVTKNAAITAQDAAGNLGDINIHANTSVGDTQVNVSGTTNNFNQNTNQTALVNASVLSSDIVSDASVVIEGGDGTKKAELTAANVNINANSEFVYDRVGGMWADIQELLGFIQEAYEQDKAIVKAAEELFKTTNAEEYLTDPTTAEAIEFFGDLNDLVSMMNMSTVNANVEGLHSVIGLPAALMAYANGQNYANFYVSSSTAGKSGTSGSGGSSGQSAQIAVAGSVNINNLENNAQVIIGKDALIDAEDDVDITATSLQKDVTFNGKVKLFIPKLASAGGAETAVGGNVGYHTGEANSTVVIAEGADISGSSIDIGADNEVMHIAATFGGGEAGTAGITGMGAYMDGESDSIVVVDDDAKLTAEANVLAQDADEEAVASNGAVTITAGNDTNIQNIIIDKTSGNIAVGVAFGMVDYDINNIAAVANNAGTANALAQTVDGKLQTDDKAHLGSDSEDDGAISANKLTVDAQTTGIIDTITVAGVTAGESGNAKGHSGSISAKIGMAGSISYNVIDGTTGAYLENIDVNITDAQSGAQTADEQSVTVNAEDDMMIGAYSGTAAIKKKGGSSGGMGATLAGAIALNESTKTVTAQIKKAQINNAKAITNTAVKDGATIAAGLALGAESAGGSSSGIASLGASASVNDIKNTVHATIEDTDINTVATDEKTQLDNIAKSNDIQVAGGVNAQYVNANLAAGAAVSQMTAVNDIKASIVGSTLEDMGTVQNYAVSDLTQVGAAVSAGIISGQSYLGVEGAVVVNDLTNTVQANISGATIEADSVDVKAYDGILEKNKHYDTLAADFDISGAEALADANAGDGDVSVEDSNLGDANAGTEGKEVYTSEQFTANDNGGNLIVTSAVGLAISKGQQGYATAGAAVSTNEIANSFHAGITGSNITTTNSTAVKAESDTLMIGVAAGAAASKGQQGVSATGSGSTLKLSNDTTAKIENGSVSASQATVDAKTKSRLINTAGQITVSKGNAALGAAVAMNDLNNTTGAYVRGVDITAPTVRISADNESKNYAIGAGVVASMGQQSGTANGSVAINKGTNDTEAIVAKYEEKDDSGTVTKTRNNTITGAQDIDVTSTDETVLKAIAGTVTVSSGYVGVGGAVAYNEIGNSGDQTNIARLDDTTITTVQGSAIDVSAADTSDILTVAAGGSVSTASQGGVAQGSVAIAKADKLAEASMNDTTIDAAGTQNVVVDIRANSNTSMTTTADVLAVGMGNAAAGAGVAVTTSDADTRAIVNGGTHFVQSESVSASSTNEIINIGIGVAGTTGQGGSLAGNVAVNNISNDTEAAVKNANISASGSVGVVADSREHLENYVGSLAATLGQGYVAIGASVGVNSISGNTTATVADSTISAQGTDLGIDGKTGLIVSADSEHELDNIIVTGGIAVSSQGGGALSGTVAVNEISGATTAAVDRSDINKDSADDTLTSDDVSVIATDKTDISSHVGAVAGGIGVYGGGAIGEASDATKLSRSVTAQIKGNADKNTVNADKVNVYAHSDHSVLTSASGLSIAAGMYGSGSVAGTVSVLNIDGTTNALAENISSNNGGMSVKAEQDKKVKMYGNSAAVSGSLIGGSVGVGVLVVNDNGTTHASLNNSSITHTSQEAADEVIADSSTDITTEVANAAASISIGAGVSGVVSVNNMNNVVQADVANTTISGEGASFDAQAKNHIKTNHSTGSGAVGVVGVGVTVGVNNIDSATVVNITNSNIAADAITIRADETRDIDQTAVSTTVGGISVPVNVLVTNIGSAIGTTEYGTYGTGNAKDPSDSVDISADIAMTDSMLQTQNNIVSGSNTGGAVGSADSSTDGSTDNAGSSSVISGLNTVDVLQGTGAITIDSGLTTDDVQSGVTKTIMTKDNVTGAKVNIDQSTLTASSQASVQAKTTTDTGIDLIGAGVDIIKVGSTVGVVNIERNSGVNIGTSHIIGDTVHIASDQAGTADLDIYQAGITGIGVNVSYGGVDLTGSNKIAVSDSTVNAASSAQVEVNDDTKADVDIIGASVGGITVGSLTAEATNNSTNEITVANSTLQSAGSVAAEVNKNNTVTASATNGLAALASINATVAVAKDSGTAKVDIQSGNIDADTVLLRAQNTPHVKADVLSVTAQLASAGGSVAHAEATGASTVNVGSSAGITADDATIEAQAGHQDGKHTVEADVMGINATSVTLAANVATAKSDIDVKVSVDASGIGVYDVDNLTIQGINAASLKARAYGVDVGGFFASGNNNAQTDGRFDTAVTVKGDSDNRIGTLTVAGSSYAAVDNDANGYGGGAIDISPLAAYADNDIVTNTTVDLSGTWNTEGAVHVSAMNGDDLNVAADSVKAAIIGGSGTRLDNNVSHNTNINITGSVAAEGSQTYIAGNQLNHEVNLDASGYGGVNIAAGDLNNTVAAKASVNIKDASLSGTGDEGSITAVAGTEATLNYDNVLKAAGVIPSAVTVSDHDIDYANTVNVSGNSSLTTAKKYQDITLATYDNSDVYLFSTADTQGGAVGTASAATNSDFDRTNRVNIGSNASIKSMNDVNLYAGAEENGITSDLAYNVVADAYNKTVIPLVTAPSISNDMSQTNQVTIDGTVDSVQHVNLIANQGLTTVTESAREYNIYTGTSGTGSIASTAMGESSGSESTDNQVVVNGTVTAGIHNELKLNVSGNAVVTSPTFDKDGNITKEGTVDFSNVVKKADNGDEWFDIGTVTTDTVEIVNSLIPRYNEVRALMKEYNSASDEYALYEKELAKLEQQMIDMGFAVKKNNTDKLEILSSIMVPAVVLPDIVVSGGNINMNADSYQVSGTMTAQGADQMSITNTSNLYLKIGDLIIGSVGGNVYHNDVLVKDADNITSQAGTQEPAINVHSSGTSNALARADIGIFGDVINSTGNVNIINDSSNINVGKDATLSARNIKLQATGGSITQESEGLLMVGGDPITKYQFSDEVAEKIQSHISNLLMQIANTQEGQTAPTLPTFDSYDDYKAWLVNTVGIAEEDLVYTIDESAGIVAGQNIYLNGINVNIDGLVQSGYQNYTVELDANAESRIADIERNWASSNKVLDDSMVIGNAEYCVNPNGGMVYNEDSGVYDYQIKVYYNPTTGRLVTEEVAPGGGHIYITGAVSSTGNGRIRAMDGTADIRIDTQNAGYDLVVNTIQAQNVDGLISIKDTATNTLTEFKNGSVSVTALEDGVSTSGRYTGSGDSYTYKPQSDMTISWTGGMTGSQKIETKKYEEDFLFWGLLDYGKTDKFVDNIIANGGKIDTTDTAKAESGDALSRGVVISQKDVDDEYSVTGRYYELKGSKSYSPVVADKQYDGTAGKIFGYGTCTYTWTETTGTGSTSTYTIKADKPIDIGFMTGSEGTIDIKGAQDVILAGNITNAENNTDGTGVGYVNIYSASGKVEGVGNAAIQSDKFVVNAYNGIDVHHNAIGSSAVANVNTVSGNIDILSTKGSLTFDGSLDPAANPSRMATYALARNSTPTMGSADGDFRFESEGSIDFGSTTLVGQRIDLISETGSITANVMQGTAPTSSDTMSASVNASAYGDITLTNNNGDMRVGHIESTDGNVTLTTSGSFIDAVGDGTLSDAESKVDRWLELGLIHANDDDSANANAAQTAKAERLEAITDRATAIGFEGYETVAQAYANDETMQTAKETYIAAVKAAGGDTTKVEAAHEVYKQAQTDYFEGKNYTADQIDIIVSYAEVANSSAYGWSKNELLYAIQDSVVNSEPGQTVLVDKANIKGNNITLNAGGGIGIDAPEQVISNDELSQIDNLQLLAQAKAGDLTWGDDGVTVRQQKPITVDASGTITINGDNNVYLAGVKGTALNISGSITTDEDVKLMSDNGIIMNSGSITANDLIVYGGVGDVGSSTNMLTTNITGSLDANTKGSVYIDQTGENTLTLQAIAVGENAVIQANNSIVMSTEEGKDLGYINADYVSLTSEAGSIGTEDDGIRILNNGVVVDASAVNGNIHLQGIDIGDMVLKDVTANELTVDSEGNVLAGDDSTASNIQADDNITINTYGDIKLNNGTMTVGTGKQITMTTANGAVIQTADHQVIADNLTVSAAKGIALVSGAETGTRYNQLHKVTLTNATGDITLGSGASKELNVTLTAKNNGNVTIRNYDVGTDNLIVTSAIEATGDISIINDELGVTSNGDINGQNVTVTATNGDVTAADITASADVLVESAAGNVTVKDVNAGGNAVLETATGKITAASVAAGLDATVTAQTGDVKIVNNLTAGKEVTAQLGNGNLYAGSIEATEGSVNLAVTAGNATVAQGIVAGNGVTAQLGNGNFYAGSINAAAGNVILDITTGNATVTQGIVAGNSVTAIVNGGDFYANSIKATEGNVSLEITGDATVTNDIDAGGSVTAKVDEGFYAGSINAAAGDVNLEIKEGNATVAQGIVAGNGVTAQLRDGNLYANSIKANKGNVILDITEGNATVTKDITASANATARLGKGDLYANSIKATEGSVSLEFTEGDATVTKDITAGNSVIALINKGNVYAGGISAAANYVSLEIATGNATVTKDIVAGKEVTAKLGNGDLYANSIKAVKDNVILEITTGDVTVTKDITAGNNATANIKKGDLYAGSIKATQGSVSLDITTGDVTVAEDVTAGNDASIYVKTGNVKTDDITADRRDVTVDVQTGSVITSDIKAGNNIVVFVDTGNTTNGDMTAGASAVVGLSDGSAQIGKITAGSIVDVDVEDPADTDEKGNATINGIEAGSDITVNTVNGDISITDDVQSDTGSITVETVKGNIDIDGSTKADSGSVDIVTNTQGDITTEAIYGNVVDVTTDNGSVTIGGAVDAISGNANIQTGSGMIHTQDSVTAKEDVIITTQSGDITADGSITAQDGSILISTNDTTDNSSITLNGKINTKDTNDNGNITVTTQRGDISINDDITIEGSGLLNIDVRESGTITTPRNDEDPSQPTVTLASINGSVDIHSANGDIDLYEVLAGNTASVIADNGNVSIHMIDGDIVVLKTTAEGTKLDVDNATVGENIKVNSYDVTIDRIEQREGETDRLIVDLAAGDPTKPMDSVNLGFGDMPNGAELTTLWTENANITVDSGEFFMPKMAVLDKADFDINGMTTTVYGTPPVRGNSNVTYWYNVGKYNPTNDLSGWYDRGVQGDWMYLHSAADGRTQFSNGVLLELDNYYYVYDQRFTGVDHLNERLAHTAHEILSRYNYLGVSYYWRYALYELPRYELANTRNRDIVVENI